MGTIYKSGVQYGSITNAAGMYVDIGSSTVNLATAVQNSVGNVAPEETNPATNAHNVGDLITLGGKLYKVTSSIAAGETFIIGTNIASTTVSDEKVGRSDIVDNATTSDSSKVASAAVAKSLQDQITTLESSTTFSATVSSAITDASIQTNLGQAFPGIKLAIYDVCIYSAGGNIPTNNAAIVTIPSGYRPQTNVLGYALVIPKTATTFTDVRVEKAYIDTSGKLALNNFIYGTQSTTIIFAHFGYRYS